jgi:hypothetical protein
MGNLICCAAMRWFRYDLESDLMDVCLAARHRAIGDHGSLSSSGMGLALFLLGLVRREQGGFKAATAFVAMWVAAAAPPVEQILAAETSGALF